MRGAYVRALLVDEGAMKRTVLTLRYEQTGNEQSFKETWKGKESSINHF